MNAESFSHYLKQLSTLYQLPYEELKSLVMQYPYFQNLHFLLVLKSRLESHKDFEKNLATAAAYSIDRAQLYKALQQLEVLSREDDNFIFAEDEVLELKDINILEERLANLERLETEEEPPSDPPQVDVPVLDFGEAPLDTRMELPETDEEDTNMSELNPILKGSSTPEKEPATAIGVALFSPDPAMVKDGAAALTAIQQLHAKKWQIAAQTEKEKMHPTENVGIPNPKKGPKPMPKQSFPSWVQQFQPAHVKPHLSELMEVQKKQGSTVEERSNQQLLDGSTLSTFARKSVQENDHMASETLAELLVAQMQYQKAIKVYERLILIFPQKSSFFAGKIENLKKLIS